MSLKIEILVKVSLYARLRVLCAASELPYIDFKSIRTYNKHGNFEFHLQVLLSFAANGCCLVAPPLTGPGN